MNEIKVIGTQEFMGKQINVIEGGFGEGQRIITAKQISEIHDVEVKEVNKLINNNIDEFEIDVDIIDLKETGDYKELVLSLGYSNAEYGNAKHIYILSEQGYIALVGLMKTDKARKIRKQFRREYFTMRQIIKSDEQLKAMYLLKAVESNGEESAIAIKNYTDLRIKEETKPLLDTIETQRPMVDFTNTVLKSKENILVRQLAKIITTEFNVNMGEKKLYKQLREWKMIFPNSTEPYQKYIDDGIFKVEEKPVETAYKTILTKTTKVTPIGQVKIVEKFRREIKNGKLNLNK